MAPIRISRIIKEGQRCSRRKRRTSTRLRGCYKRPARNERKRARCLTAVERSRLLRWHRLLRSKEKYLGKGEKHAQGFQVAWVSRFNCDSGSSCVRSSCHKPTKIIIAPSRCRDG